MTTTSELIYRQAVTIRYAAGFGDRMAESAVPLEREILAAVREFEDTATSRDFEALLISDTRNRRVKALFSSVDDAFFEVGKKITDDFTAELYGFAEQDTAAKMKILYAESAPPLPADIMKQPILGISAAATIAALFPLWNGRIRAAIVNAEQNDTDIVMALRGSREFGYKDGAFHPMREALVRTGETLVSGVAANTSAAVNVAAGIEKEMLAATLDHRTCLTCAPLDGYVYPVGTGPRPPLHPRCRCVRVPWEGRVGERPFVNDDRSVKNIPLAERPGKIGQTRLIYPDWFDSLSASAQRNVLGPSRYDLWKRGDIELSDFSAREAGPILNLKDLGDIYGDF